MNTESEQQTPRAQETAGESLITVEDLAWSKWNEFVKAHPFGASVVVAAVVLTLVVVFFYQLHVVAKAFFGDAMGDVAVAVVFVALFGGILAFLMIRVARHLRASSASNSSTKEQSSPSTKKSLTAWQYVLVFAVLFNIVSGSLKRDERASAEARAIAKSQQSESLRLQRQNATRAYWQTAVANLHQIRFQEARGDEPADAYFARMCTALRDLINRAEMHSPVNVDRDLVDMVRLHLVIERKFLQLKGRMDGFLKQANLPEGTDTVTERVKRAGEIFAPMLADHSLVEKLPEGELRLIFQETSELILQRDTQLHQIGIMQAVLQERYPGVKFLLPQIVP